VFLKFFHLLATFFPQRHAQSLGGADSSLLFVCFERESFLASALCLFIRIAPCANIRERERERESFFPVLSFLNKKLNSRVVGQKKKHHHVDGFGVVHRRCFSAFEREEEQERGVARCWHRNGRAESVVVVVVFVDVVCRRFAIFDFKK